MVNYVENGSQSNLAVNGVIWLIDGVDSLYLTTSGELYATGTGGTAIEGASTANVTIAGQVFGETAIRTGQQDSYGGGTVSVLKSGIVTGESVGIQMQGSGNSMTIAGQVFGANAITMGSSFGAGVSTVSVLDGGIVSGYYGVYMHGYGNNVMNDGTISGTYAISGNASKIVNTGSILSDSTAVYLTTNGDPFSLVNQGVISSTQIAILCFGLGADKVVNQGTITGTIYLEGATTAS